MPARTQHLRRSHPGDGMLGGFNPRLLPGLVLWLRADMGISIGTGVSAWADQSGAGNSVTQGTGANQPAFIANGLNGKPVVRFTAASSHFLAKASTNLFGAGNFSILMTWKWSAAATRQVAFGNTDTVNGGALLGTSEAAGVKRTIGYVASGDVTGGNATTTAETWSVIFSGGTSNAMRVNRATQALTGSFGLANPGASAAIRFGSYNGSNLFLDGDIAEVVAYTRALSAAENVLIENYMATRWGTP